jgi:hypothetical protein
MNRFVVFFVLSAAVMPWVRLSGQPCAAAVNIYTFTSEGHVYDVVKEKKSWADAAACAVELGGYLAVIDDDAEQAALFDAVLNGAGVPNNYVTVPDGGGVAYVWIGATDKVTEGTWIWDGANTGAGVNFWNGQGAAGAGGGAAVGGLYNNWGGSSAGVIMEPDDFGGTQDAAAMALRGWPGGSGALGIAGEWNDINLANSIYFIVERQSTGIQEDKSMDFLLTPNPVKNLLSVTSSQEGLLFNNIRVLTSDGRQARNIMIPPSKTYQINMDGYPAGHYLIGVGTPGGTLNYYSIIKE